MKKGLKFVALLVVLILVVAGCDSTVGPNDEGVTPTPTPREITWATKAPMPTARIHLASGVVNNKIYAIGGCNIGCTISLTTVEEYDPATDTWTTKASMPTDRGALAIGVVTDKIYAIGGRGSNGSYLTTVEEYGPATDTWTTKASMPTGRRSLAVGGVNNKIYAIGGFNGSGSYLSKVEEYDPATNQWSTKTSMPTTRGFLAVGVVGDKIYAIGGYDGSNFLTTVEEYDPATDTWTTKASMPTDRGALAIGVVTDKIYAIGGCNIGCSSVTVTSGSLTTVEEYDPATDTWTNCGGNCAPMPTVKMAVYLDVVAVNNKIYAIGKVQIDGGEYDPVTNQWTTKDPVSWGSSAEPWGPSKQIVGAVGNKIYIIGYRGVFVQGGWNRLTKVGEYDPATDQWTERESVPEGWSHDAAGVVGDKIYAIGGYSPEACLTEEGEHAPFLCRRTVEKYDPATNTWETKAMMLSNNSFGGQDYIDVVVANNKIYVVLNWGGGPSNPSSVYEYDPAADQWVIKTRISTHRCGLAAGVVNNKIYVIGGREGECISGGGLGGF